MTLAPAVISPCTRVCAIGEDGLCRGCGRTLSEIAAWRALGEAERRQIVAGLSGRRRVPLEPAG